MKRATVIAMALGLALSACTTGTTIGDDLGKVGTGIESPSPTPSIEVPKRKKAAKKTETKKEEPKFEVNTIIIAVRDNHSGFEYKLPGKDWASAFNGGPAAFPEDIIIFKNMDREGCSAGFLHSWVNEKNDQYGEGKLFNSKPVECGKQFKWTVPNKPGEYRYKDGVVPYRPAQGPLLILPPRA